MKKHYGFFAGGGGGGAAGLAGAVGVNCCFGIWWLPCISPTTLGLMPINGDLIAGVAGAAGMAGAAGLFTGVFLGGFI